MPTDFHSRPYSPETETKLNLFRLYFREWLPVFLVGSARPKEIYVVDFMAGPGTDIHGSPGTPSLIIDVLQDYRDLLCDFPGQVKILFNELKPAKFRDLTILTDQRRSQMPSNCVVDTFNCGFSELFNALYQELSDPSRASLLLIDQTGIQYVNPAVFQQLSRLRSTDFMFFISSSYLWRFKEHPAMAKHLPIPSVVFDGMDYYHVHDSVRSYYQSLVPQDVELYLGHFSLKKGSNIYGVLLGTHHLLGIHKFVRACWKIDEIRGAANFDIDKDNLDAAQPSLFAELDRPQRLQMFEAELEAAIRQKKVSTNRDAIVYALQQGITERHIRPVLGRLQKEGVITTERIPLSYETVIRRKSVKSLGA